MTPVTPVTVRFMDRPEAAYRLKTMCESIKNWQEPSKAAIKQPQSDMVPDSNGHNLYRGVSEQESSRPTSR